ncbi:hypothetical protein BDV39DRAFT_169599, partial [Aspergillus sergii]
MPRLSRLIELTAYRMYVHILGLPWLVAFRGHLSLGYIFNAWSVDKNIARRVRNKEQSLRVKLKKFNMVLSH